MRDSVKAAILCLGMGLGLGLGASAGAMPLAPSADGARAAERTEGPVTSVRWVCNRWGDCFWRPGPPPRGRVVCRWRWRDTPWGPRRVRVCTRRW